ncbi:hypothetical protein [Achromobacter spanius]|uniref:Uncharacterized protein n=1 Tax=Achromobacter spanius TaxID=217203 RepID=A0A2S0I926_9BURK|nr:hypothetical protein [Achromobacter spanius]AVJ28546.1 hypothetical protein CLM73_16305 [Achromobacter spanius]
MQAETASARWTLANLASTYLFWALIGAFLASAFGVMVFNYALVWLPSFRDAESSPRELTMYFSIGGNGFGILLGILLARAKRTEGLAAIVAAGAACYVLAWFALPDLGAGRGLFLIFFGHVIRTAFAFAIAFNLAGAASDRHAFAGAFAVWSTCELVSSSAIYYAASSTFLRFQSDGDWALVGIAAMGFALLLLASVRGRSFDEAPSERHRPLKPVSREGATVTVVAASPWVALGAMTLLGAVVPKYVNVMSYWSTAVTVVFVCGLVACSYWVYRIHGEVAYFHRSSNLFTPRAALLLFLLVPWGTSILLLTLGGVLREVQKQRPSSRRRFTGWFNAWCIVFPPVAMGMVQEQINELAEGQAESESESSPQFT